MGFEFGAYPQKHVIHSFVWLWLCAEFLSATTAPRRDARLFHVDIFKLKVAILDHG